MNKIFRSLITHPAGFQLELLPRERTLSKAVTRCLDNPAIAGEYTWEVHELTIMGDSKKLVSGRRGTSVPSTVLEWGAIVKEASKATALYDRGTGYPPAAPIDPSSKEPV